MAALTSNTENMMLNTAGPARHSPKPNSPQDCAVHPQTATNLGLKLCTSCRSDCLQGTSRKVNHCQLHSDAGCFPAACPPGNPPLSIHRMQGWKGLSWFSRLTSCTTRSPQVNSCLRLTDLSGAIQPQRLNCQQQLNFLSSLKLRFQERAQTLCGSRELEVVPQLPRTDEATFQISLPILFSLMLTFFLHCISCYLTFSLFCCQTFHLFTFSPLNSTD